MDHFLCNKPLLVRRRGCYHLQLFPLVPVIESTPQHTCWDYLARYILHDRLNGRDSPWLEHGQHRCLYSTQICRRAKSPPTSLMKEQRIHNPDVKAECLRMNFANGFMTEPAANTGPASPAWESHHICNRADTVRPRKAPACLALYSARL